MKIFLGVVFGILIGIITALIGYQLNDWQFWAITIPANIVIQPFIQLA